MMIKRSILFSLIIAQVSCAYGSDNNIKNIEKVANEYMSSISGGYNVKPEKILTLKNGQKYAVIYRGIGTGENIGAMGNMGMQFVEVNF